MVAPMFAPYDACVSEAFRGVPRVQASGDYALNIRVHLCIGPEAP
jgi:hypothetical protein